MLGTTQRKKMKFPISVFRLFFPLWGFCLFQISYSISEKVSLFFNIDFRWWQKSLSKIGQNPFDDPPGQQCPQRRTVRGGPRPRFVSSRRLISPVIGNRNQLILWLPPPPSSTLNSRHNPFKLLQTLLFGVLGPRKQNVFCARFLSFQIRHPSRRQSNAYLTCQICNVC